jgi:hypothetical protein|tara:strand:- start:122 stop:406 length:285 start_codon:yes stop_codon:yes gene_type:complete
LNKEIFNYLETVTQSLNIKNKDNLNKIYLQIISDKNITTINLGNSSIDFENEVDYLIIKMDESTFYNLKDNKKHPEDLMFDEKIKIKGNLDLLK